MNILATDVKHGMVENKFLVLKIVKNVKHLDQPIVNTTIEG